MYPFLRNRNFSQGRWSAERFADRQQRARQVYIYSTWFFSKTARARAIQFHKPVVRITAFHLIPNMQFNSLWNRRETELVESAHLNKPGWEEVQKIGAKALERKPQLGFYSTQIEEPLIGGRIRSSAGESAPSGSSSSGLFNRTWNFAVSWSFRSFYSTRPV